MKRTPLKRGTSTLSRAKSLKRGTATLKRTPLSRSQGLSTGKAGLKRSVSPSARKRALERARARYRAKKRAEGYAEWKVPVSGHCQSCGNWCPRLERHHVYDLQACKRDNLPLYDLANSMLLCPEPCHSQHTNAYKRIRMARVPDAAIAFAVEWLGAPRAELFFLRTYDGAAGDGRLLRMVASALDTG